MAFYKALEKIELKKYSEASDDNFGVVFYSKGSLKTTKLFDNEVKGKVSNFFEDESKASLMVSKEFSGLSRDILFVKDFDKKKPKRLYKTTEKIFKKYIFPKPPENILNEQKLVKFKISVNFILQ